MRKFSEKFINVTKETERRTMHKGLDLVLDLIESTSKEQLSATGSAIESYANLLKKYCAALTAMERPDIPIDDIVKDILQEEIYVV